MDSDQKLLRRRWDNTPHFPDLSGFPYHCHVGAEDVVEPSAPLNLAQLLDHIASRNT